jgi:hypothetical protein
MKFPRPRLSAAAAVASLFAATVSHANAPAGRYTTPAAGAVYDTKTKLTWQQGFASCSNSCTAGWGSSIQPGTAQYVCATLTLNGGGWRLPTLGELQSLVDYSRQPDTSSGMIDPTFFPNTPGFPFWSSTPVAGSGGSNAWAVQFADGSTEVSGTANTWDVRCVR